MNEEILLHQLEELAGRLEIAVRYENLNAEETSNAGGLCRLKGTYVLIIHSQATAKGEVWIITEALRPFPIGDTYVKSINGTNFKLFQRKLGKI